MRISALDIRQQQFSKRMLRGFDPQEVEAFLEHVAEDYESVLKENTLLKEQIALHEERSRGIVEHERTLQETLVTTHRLTEEMKHSAKREAESIVRDAEARVEKVLSEARAEEAQLRDDLTALRHLRNKLLQDLRGTLARYERLLSSDEDTEEAAGTAS
jgi:cell division initiation protein